MKENIDISEAVERAIRKKRRRNNTQILVKQPPRLVERIEERTDSEYALHTAEIMLYGVSAILTLYYANDIVDYITSLF